MSLMLLYFINHTMYYAFIEEIDVHLLYFLIKINISDEEKPSKSIINQY